MTVNISSTTHTALRDFLASHTEHAGTRKLSIEFDRLTAQSGDATNELIQLYRHSLPLIETTLGEEDFAASAISRYQDAYRELEALIKTSGIDDRHSFVVIIPIADRPLHLKECLHSLLELCRAFNYGGSQNGRYTKVMALIADDSKEPENIARHRELSDHFSNLGLETNYFGIEEQLAQLEHLATDIRDNLSRIIGQTDRGAFYHKGPSILRNIVYLKLNEMCADGVKRLFYFVDSDQEFRVKISCRNGDIEAYSINYLDQLDRHFSEPGISILTGKVVGDPPVSPAVMAGTFLDDVIAFVQKIGTSQHDMPCSFHGQPLRADTGAAYHDMAGLFGFENGTLAYSYRCPLTHPHTHADCLSDFALRLGQFFDGVHPTRITYFNRDENTTDTRPARTVYTGNYILRPAALRYFIPFATLRLRMAGPALGRLIQPELGAGFVSANLPLLHKRTVTQTGQSEYRPGVARMAQHVDLSGELERQYFGDVMLFSLEKLTALGYPQCSVSDTVIEKILTETTAEMAQRYTTMHSEIMHKLNSLNQFIANQHWWQNFQDSHPAQAAFENFLRNMALNFGPDATGFQRIFEARNQTAHLNSIHTAIKYYAEDRACWDAVINNQTNAQSRA